MKFLLFFLFPILIHAETLRVAVIDSGLDPVYKNKLKLCPEGHKDFTGTSIYAPNSFHGTHVAGLIQKYAKDADFCLIIIKYWQARMFYNTQHALNRAFEYILQIKPDIINYSGGGSSINKYEKALIQRILNSGIIFISAAGNRNEDLEEKPYYPACYDERIWVVSGKDLFSGNYGKTVDAYVDGKDQIVFNQKMSGTSQSTAKFTGMIVRNLSYDRRKAKIRRFQKNR